MTIRDYALPPRQEWLARVRRLPQVRRDQPVSEHLAEERKARDRELATRVSDPTALDARAHDRRDASAVVEFLLAGGREPVSVVGALTQDDVLALTAGTDAPDLGR